MYSSLVRHCPQFRLWILCLDQECYDFFESRNLDYIVPISLYEFERENVDLALAKQNRSLIEYYFTCTASFTSYVMNQNHSLDLLTYLDADLFFFSDPEPIYRELENHSVGIIEHRFPESMKKLERYGIFNVAWVSFRRDEAGLACLELWRTQCLEWCYDRLEAERFADQKYLDRWPELFDRVRIIEHKGANLAPWNVARYRITEVNDSVSVDGDNLLFYHFHGIKRVGSWPIFDTGLGDSRARLTPVLRAHVYRQYLLAQLDTESSLRDLDNARVEDGGVRQFVNSLWTNAWLRSLSRIPVVLYSVLVCHAYMIFRGR